MAHSYKQAGVNIEAGYEAVERMKKHVAKTARIGALGSLGGFGGMFDLSSLGYKQPVLISGADGVGTKLMLAFKLDRHDTIGIDCVAMCVNDIVVQGAEPLFFLDYIACGKAIPEKIEHIVKGIADGCVEAGCALIGGETAEMPGMYSEDEYDVAGFAVGVAEKYKVVTGDGIVPGDVLIGLASSGLHSNGYSLVRKIIKDADLRLDDIYEPFSRPLGEELLTPTRIYVRAVLEALKQFRVKGMAHITGGGFIENIPRMLPKGLQAEIDYGSWPIPPIFNFLQQHGKLQRTEMFNIFNMGIGFVMAVDSDVVPDVVQLLESFGEQVYVIGRIKEGTGVSFAGGKIE
ncbi:phosphoribosylformylglycinamidine cyclo-ligase [Anoxybacillus pushchinoensis]|uniref:Phosphoribosylformylglycinamidine cyclo-ligase n=1 Tax=Anoxybacillus pushchinoensis TaxID=150248 RepID=A0A1I0TCW0_9BACL|nr:phosphoribosylformylglycinamidine cyclo-ligase [Anoxybacillus pushchinoensis]SFA49560.1 phosphoribosylformylglycinamidine cyclo-ligase [Anoxybacillus pushchinoensis]